MTEILPPLILWFVVGLRQARDVRDFRPDGWQGGIESSQGLWKPCKHWNIPLAMAHSTWLSTYHLDFIPWVWEFCLHLILFGPIYDLSTSLNCIIMLKPMHNDLRRLCGTQLWSTYPCIGHNSWTWSSVRWRIHSSWPSVTSSRHREDVTTDNKGCGVNHTDTQVLRR